MLYSTRQTSENPDSTNKVPLSAAPRPESGSAARAMVGAIDRYLSGDSLEASELKQRCSSPRYMNWEASAA